jgi:hypothetical protein
MPVVRRFGTCNQEDCCEFKASLDYIVNVIVNEDTKIMSQKKKKKTPTIHATTTYTRTSHKTILRRGE